jgi:hypothetical protein
VRQYGLIKLQTSTSGEHFKVLAGFHAALPKFDEGSRQQRLSVSFLKSCDPNVGNRERRLLPVLVKSDDSRYSIQIANCYVCGNEQS